MTTTRVEESGELARRAVWIIATPFVSVANRIGLCSYKWVNICVGARRPDLFDELWHHEYYGTPIRVLPSRVILSGIDYTAAAHEGIVTFFDDATKCRISFLRDAIEKEGLWYLELAGSHVAAPHVQKAYGWVCAVFGGSHEWLEEGVYVR